MAWLADMREQEDREIAERKQALEARYAQGQISAEVYEAWQHDISWLSYYLEKRRRLAFCGRYWALRVGGTTRGLSFAVTCACPSVSGGDGASLCALQPSQAPPAGQGIP